jgi:tRNA G18 (ribose-2'-O)-methylase SpoU
LAVIPINDPSDARVAAFRDIRERDLTGRQGLFVAEGEVVLRVLCSPASLCRPVAALVAEKRIAALADVIEGLPTETPVLSAPQAVLDGVAGFHLHRGILALGEKPALRPLAELMASMGDDAVVVVACGIGNHDNVGGIFRAAAAFGAAAVLLDVRCCDPFYRKAIRVSVGAVLRTPMSIGMEAGEIIESLKTEGFRVMAMTPSSPSPLHLAPRGERTAIVLGAEGPGLPIQVLERCETIGIPMSGGFDSLNVGTAGAIALHHFTRQA